MHAGAPPPARSEGVSSRPGSSPPGGGRGRGGAGASRRGAGGALAPRRRGDGREFGAHGGRTAAARGSRLALTDGRGEHRDDVAAVADAPLLPRGATASARLALAWSSHRLL